jgi:dimethylglycine dehydrogenase
MGSYGLRAFHARWFARQANAAVRIDDISDHKSGFSISGPEARRILQSVTEADLADLRMMQCRTADVGLHRARIARLSLSGELAYEVTVDASEHASLRALLLRAGAAQGLREIGFNAMFSMRLEKGIGIWNAEFTQGRTPAEVGLDRWVAPGKGDFIGCDALRNAPAPDRVLAMLEVDADGADATGYEPVWLGDRLVGITTSGGYGHRTGKSLAMAMLDRPLATEGTDLTVQIVGAPRSARVVPLSPYDPGGARMRA